jgi:hypothetical protein
MAESRGQPFLPGIVESIDGQVVLVTFPGKGTYQYNHHNLRQFQTQFLDGKFVPLKPVNKRQRNYYREIIKKYENALKVM